MKKTVAYAIVLGSLLLLLWGQGELATHPGGNGGTLLFFSWGAAVAGGVMGGRTRKD